MSSVSSLHPNLQTLQRRTEKDEEIREIGDVYFYHVPTSFCPRLRKNKAWIVYNVYNTIILTYNICLIFSIKQNSAIFIYKTL